MPPFRKSGSFVRFYVEGDLPRPESPEFLAALAKRRFRTIENAASEESSFGWVCPSDPSGDNFLREEICCDPYARLRIRVDKKKIPAAWLRIYLDAEVKARGGKRLTAKERKEAKEDIADKLLPRVLPSVQFLDVLYDPNRRAAYLFSSSQAAKECCALLFYETFATRLVEGEPFETATRLKLPQEQVAYLEKVAPLPIIETKARPTVSRATPVSSATSAPESNVDSTVSVSSATATSGTESTHAEATEELA